MYKRISVVILLVLCFIIRNAKALHCYPNYCTNVTDVQQMSNYPCSIMSVEKDDDCSKLDFRHFAEPKPVNNYQLTAFAFDSRKFQRSTLINLTINDIDFNRLIIRYQSLLNESSSSCAYVTLHENVSYPLGNTFFFSCPSFDEFAEGSPYRLEYFISGKDDTYSKEVYFTIPHNKSINENNDIHTFVPFIYIDISDDLSIVLHIQALPEKFNVTDYRIWLINNETGLIADIKTSSDKKIGHRFPLHEGVYYFQVAALHSNCSEYGCVNATSPLITMNKASHRLLIMIVSTIWIPPVTLYACYYTYKLCRKKERSFLFQPLTVNANTVNCSKGNNQNTKTSFSAGE